MIQATVNPATVSQPRYGLIVEKDVDVPLRDGLALKCDVFRPDDEGVFPAIMTLGPYPKDEHMDYGDAAEESGPYMHWESANPEWWIPRGYVQVRVDMRGSGRSPGSATSCQPRRRWTTTTLSSGRRRSRGAVAVLVSWGSRTSP